jgi:molecular chaperone GrpE
MKKHTEAETIANKPMDEHAHAEMVDTGADATPTVEQEVKLAEEAAAQPAEQKTEPAKAEGEEWKERYVRLVAEFDNFKKRTNREKEEILRGGNERLLQALLPVLDDLERTLKAAEKATDLASVQEGIRLVSKNFLAAMAKQGIAEVPAVGQPFDSAVHEAIANIPAPSDELKGKVVEAIEKGYSFNGKVIRFAKVIVGE